MSYSSSPDIRHYFGAGSPLTDVTDWILSDVAIGDEGIYVDGTPYGATHHRNKAVGVADQPDITVEGFFDDADSGPMDLFGTISGVNTAAYTWKTVWTATSPESSSTVPVHIKDFKILGKVKDVTRFRVVLTQAGATVHLRQGA